MKKERLKELYEKLIIPLSREPFNYDQSGLKESQVLAYNPVCGDKFEITLGTRPQFSGKGCSLSMASTSLLLMRLEQMPKAEWDEFINRFLNAVETGAPGQWDDELELLVELRNFEGRMDCIKLSWEAVRDHLLNLKNED